eukprot:5159625-Prymnesium_polylepis.1
MDIQQFNAQAAIFFFCDVACERRGVCPDHPGDMDEEASDEAAAGIGCQCMCCKGRMPPPCYDCDSSPCDCVRSTTLTHPDEPTLTHPYTSRTVMDYEVCPLVEAAGRRCACAVCTALSIRASQLGGVLES